jgi:hypothetical protein
MWQAKGKLVAKERFLPFEPLRVLNFFDGPRIFTFKDSDDALCLACWSDEGDDAALFLVVAVSEKIIADLECGLLSVREALAQPRLWAVEASNDGVPTRAWLIDPDSVPADAQPQPRAMLHRSLEPTLSLRATGESIRRGEIPGSVVKSTVEGAQRALKTLAEFEMDSPSRKGRPSRALQKLYDLPVQKTLAASFEVQFRSPLSEPDLFLGLDEKEIRDEKDVLVRVGDHLKTGLKWLTNTKDALALPVPDDLSLSRAIIKALKFLTPSPRGPIHEFEIRGELATDSADPVRLSRASRSIVNGAASRLPDMKEQKVSLTGRIREVNEKLLRFELHDLTNPPSPTRVCQFEPELWDEVYELLGVEESVEVLGIETSSTSHVRVLNLIRSGKQVTP